MSAQALLLTDMQAALLRRTGELHGLKTFEAAFVSWMLPSSDGQALLLAAAQEASIRSGAERHYRDVATLGLASAHVGFDAKVAAVSSLEWLLGREGTVRGGVPMGFMVDGPALMGISLLGIKFPELKDRIGQWMEKFLEQSLSAPGISAWQKTLILGAAQILGRRIPAGSIGKGMADVRVALHSRGVVPIAPEEQETLELAALGLIREADPISQDRELCAIQLASLEFIRRKAPVLLPGRATPQQVAELLRGIPSALRKWTWEERSRTGRGEARKWHIDHEYHVQNLLWTVLAPIFSDLVEETYVREVGPVRPRLDIGIPSLKLIIEIKFVRATGQLQGALREIAEDSALYLTDKSRYDQIIAFVWDDARRTEQHAQVIQGLKSLVGVIDAVIVSRPGSWIDIVQADESSQPAAN